MTTILCPDCQTLSLRAMFLAERIDIRALERVESLAESPLTLRAGGGCVVLFRYGAVVMFGVQPMEQVAFLRGLEPFLTGVFEHPEDEAGDIHIDSLGEERVDNEGIWLRDTDVSRLQIVADILAKSVVLSHYEKQVASVFDSIEPMAMELRSRGRVGSQSRQLLSQIGHVLLVQQKMVGRVEVMEKPDLLWDRSELERLYLRLEDEYELAERQAALDRKLDLISRTVETILDLLQTKRSLRVEWYIVVLIVVEILLTLYEMFVSR